MITVYIGQESDQTWSAVAWDYEETRVNRATYEAAQADFITAWNARVLEPANIFSIIGPGMVKDNGNGTWTITADVVDVTENSRAEVIEAFCAAYTAHDNPPQDFTWEATQWYAPQTID